MDGFGGDNDLERSLRMLLQTKKVRWKNSQNLHIQEDITDDQARKLGQFLLDKNHQVSSISLHTHRLTAEGEYQLLLDFLRYSSDLNSTTLYFGRFGSEENVEEKEVVRRFLQAVAGSTTIESLKIDVFGTLVTKDSLLDLLHETTSISELKVSGCFTKDWPTDDAIENAFVENTTVKTLGLVGSQCTLVNGVIQAMKRSPTIEHLRLFSKTSFYSGFSRALPLFTGLRRLDCIMWPDFIHDAIMDGFKSNSSLVEFYVGAPNTAARIRQERIEAEVHPYLVRNRAFRALTASPMAAPQGVLTNVNFLPIIFPATKDALFHRDLIFSLLTANPQMFQFAPRRR